MDKAGGVPNFIREIPGALDPILCQADVSSGRHVSLSDFADRDALLVIFLCAHCPYVVHVAPELARLGRDYAGRSVALVGITANDTANYPQDAPEPTAAFARAQGFTFPILFDESQRVAQAYTAACTPDFFLFGKERRLAYRGQLDRTRPRIGTPDGADLRAAIDAVLGGTPVSSEQLPSIGCNIKWKAGNEPAFFGH